MAQPAEEVGTGARALIEDGLFSRFPRPDFAVAQHVTPDLDAGVVGIAEGFAFANVDTWTSLSAARAATAPPPPDHRSRGDRRAARAGPPDHRQPGGGSLEGVVVTVGSIHGGSAPNIIPDAVRLQLTIQLVRRGGADRILASVHRISRHVALAAGAPEDRLPEVTLRDEFTPAVYNDPELCRRAAAAFRAALGADAVVARRPEMIGEDFGAYRLQHPPIPSLMFRVGTSDPYRAPGTARRRRSTRGITPPRWSRASAPAPSPCPPSSWSCCTAERRRAPRGCPPLAWSAQTRLRFGSTRDASLVSAKRFGLPTL